MDDQLELSRIAALKKTFGASLTEEDERVLAAFERTNAGRAFAAEAAEMRRMLSGIAEVRVVPVEARELRERFETVRRDEARALLHRAVPFCLGVCAIFGAGGLVLTWLASGTPRAAGIANVWILLGAGALVACVTVLMRAARVVSSPDLTAFLTRTEKEAGRSFGWNVRTFLVLAVAAGLIAPMLGWKTALLVAATSLVLLRGFALALRRAEQHRRMRSDAAMWDWWYGDGSHSGA